MNKKVIIVTGASSGMGKDFALQLLKQGHKVYGLARRVDQMQDIISAGGKAIAMDVTEESQIQSAIDTVLSEQGYIDVLINNVVFQYMAPWRKYLFLRQNASLRSIFLDSPALLKK